MKRFLFLAAAFAFFGGIIWSCGNQGKPVDPNALFANFYKPGLDKERAQKIAGSLESFGLAGAQTDSDSLKMALELFEAGKNEESVAMLEQILAIHPDNETAQYYVGVIHMAEGRFDKAIEMFTPISNKEDSDLHFDALWNLGLCYLKTENGMEDARTALSSLANDAGYPDQQTAKALVNQLK